MGYEGRSRHSRTEISTTGVWLIQVSRHGFLLKNGTENFLPATKDPGCPIYPIESPILVKWPEFFYGPIVQVSTSL